ncbi:MAG: methyltransferase [Bacteroidales bacterium]|nr:methyltransferase [Bacteroidales bacterium]
MTNKRETLTERLRGNLSGWKETVEEILKEDIFDEKGVVDADFALSILKSVNEAMSFAETAVNALLRMLGGSEAAPSKKKEDAGAKWTVEEILKKCELRDNVLYLPKIQLNKKAYQAVKTWIEEAGGQWSTKQQGFTFDFDAKRVCGMLLQGKRCNLKQEFQYFGTPDAVADLAVAKFSSLTVVTSVLEPSAGRGALVRAIRRRCPKAVVDCFELMPENVEFLRKEPGANVVGSDFAECVRSYDRIIANPPFSNNQDIDHVYRMWDHLNAGGEMSVIVSQHWKFASERKCEEFRKWLGDVGAETEDVDGGAFKESGTTVATTLLFIKKNRQ